MIVYPAGGGVGIIGIYKALRELRDLGWVNGKLPRLVAVQASGCAPIVAAFAAGAAEESQPWPEPARFPSASPSPRPSAISWCSTRCGAPRGLAVAVDDEEHLLADQREMARLEGSLICPEGAACVTAVGGCARQAGWPPATRWSC